LDYFNKGWSDYTGLSGDQSFGSGWQNAIQADDLKSFLKTWITAMTEEKSFETECRIISADGQVRWFWIKAVSEISQKGQVLAWIGTCTDIHDRKMMELKLIQTEKEASAANLSKTSFLANMSHEIRTPMNAILGFTELMLDPDQTSEERISCIHTVQRNASQLLKIIDEILDISKVESGHLQIEKVDVDLGNVLEDIRSLLRLSALDKALDFKIHLDTPIPRVIKTDPTRLRQILLNLIGNSIKFTSRGYVHVDVEWIKKASKADVNKLHIRISDSGVGIKASHADRLFQPFVQEDSATTRNFGGTGLGLALSRELARAMGGDVILEQSAPGEGSVFVLEIAAEPVTNTFISSLEVETSTKSTRRKGDKRLLGMNVLLVEDVQDNQALIGHFLHMAGATVDVANNGKEGVTKALGGHHHAVLMDIQMPVLDGYEATRQLRAAGYQTPIIALTAHALKEEREKSIEAGCVDHLSKPVDYNGLVEHLARFLPGHDVRADRSPN
jgi:PAS domain S-box-containing protein